MEYFTAFIVSFIVFYRYYKEVFQLEKKIENINTKVMASTEDLMYEMIKEVKSDVKSIKVEVAQLTKDVIVLKTKAAVYGSLAGSAAVTVFTIVKELLL